MLHESIETTQPPPPSVTKIVELLKTILTEDLDIRVKREEIDENASLLEEGLALDSVVIIELIGEIERRFGFQLGDEHLRTDLFRSLTTLAEFIAVQTAPAELRAEVEPC